MARKSLGHPTRLKVKRNVPPDPFMNDGPRDLSVLGGVRL